jgi:hypothetical protein
MLMVYLCTFFLVHTVLLYCSFIYPLMHVPQPPAPPRRGGKTPAWNQLSRPRRNADDYNQPASRANR